MDLKSVIPTSMRRRKRGRLLANLAVAAIVVVALVASLGSLALAATSFPDVPSSHPNYAAITDLADRGIISGKTDGKFYPSDPVTRQQFAKMIVGTGGYPVSEANVCPFGDVEVSGPGDLYPDNYVAVCAARGITLGKTETTFDPTGFITRYQVISMVVRTANDLEPALLAAPPAGYGTWAGDPTHGANAARAEYNDLLDGLDLASLNPLGNMTRGEVAQVLHNLLVKLGTSPGTTGGTYTLSVSAAGTGSGTVSKAPDQASYNAGATVLLTATAASGSVFMGWSGDASGDTNPLSVTMNSNKTIVATFNTGTMLYTLNASVPGGGGTITKSPNSAMYPSGTSVQLTAVPGTGYSFHHWAGGATGTTSPVTVVMDSNKTVTAVFVPAPVDEDYEDLGAAATSGVAVASGYPGYLWLFVRGPEGQLMHRFYDGSWANWEDLAGKVKAGSNPAAVCSRGFARTDVFIRGTNDHLWYTYKTGGDWSDWDDLDNTIFSDPAVCSPHFGDLAVFWRSSSGALTMRRYVDGTWYGTQSVAGTIKSGTSPAVVSWPTGQENGDIHVFVQGTNNHLWHRYYRGSSLTWTDWYDMGVTITSSPTAASWEKGRVDVFYRGTNGNLFQLAGDGTDAHWLPPKIVNDTDIGADMDAVSPLQENRIHVFVRGADNHLLWTWWNGTKWLP